MSIIEVFKQDPIHQPEIFSALKEQLQSARGMDQETFPVTSNYGGGWHGGLVAPGVGLKLALSTIFDNGTKLEILGDLDGIGATACYGGGRIDVNRVPADLPGLTLWAEVFQTPGIPGWPPWLRVDFYLGKEFVGRASGVVIGITTFAYARGYVICKKS